jgi:crotonobetainyl-CoA:carnitine CoA-transferase CaiB-like acyl-CoA transferase
LAKENPGLVYCSISGFGQTGPLAQRPGYDQLMQAYAGLLSVTGERGRPAVRIGPTAIDILTGTHAAFGILAALRERDKSGQGQWVDTSLYEAAIHLMTQWICDFSMSHRLLGRSGPYFPFTAPYGIFMASDREFYIGVGNDKMWARFCEAIGHTELIKDFRFLTNKDRAGNQRLLYDILEPLFKERPAAHWVELCEQLGIANSLINEVDEVVEQAQALSREAVVPIEGLGTIRSAGLPIKLSRTAAEIRTPPPSLGADGETILREIGMSDADIAAARDAGAVR